MCVTSLIPYENLFGSVGRETVHVVVTAQRPLCREVHLVLSLVRHLLFVLIIHWLPTHAYLSLFELFAHLVYLSSGDLVVEPRQTLIVAWVVTGPLQVLLVVGVLRFDVGRFLVVGFELLGYFVLVLVHTHLLALWPLSRREQYAFGITSPIILECLIVCVLLLMLTLLVLLLLVQSLT